MDEYTFDDIIGSFPANDNEREKRLEGIDDLYRAEHPVLNYYYLINPLLYRDELKPGSVIRYSSRIDRLSCASRIIKVKLNPDKTVKEFKLVAINKGTESEIWEIYPELYYIFKYDPKSTRLGRAFHNAGLSKEDINDSNNEIRKMIIRADEQRKTDKILSNLYSSEKNGLNIDTLIRSDPTIASKVVRSNKPTNKVKSSRDHDRIINHQPLQSLLEDSDEESDKEYRNTLEEELGFIPDPDYFDNLEIDTKPNKTKSKSNSKQFNSKQSNSKQSNFKQSNFKQSKFRQSSTKQEIQVSTSHQNTNKLMELINEEAKKQNGKVKLTNKMNGLM